MSRQRLRLAGPAGAVTSRTQTCLRASDRFEGVAERGAKSAMGRKLYVGNLPYETGEAELTELFGRSGTVDVTFPMNDDDGTGGVERRT